MGTPEQGGHCTARISGTAVLAASLLLGSCASGPTKVASGSPTRTWDVAGAGLASGVQTTATPADLDSCRSAISSLPVEQSVDRSPPKTLSEATQRSIGTLRGTLVRIETRPTTAVDNLPEDAQPTVPKLETAFVKFIVRADAVDGDLGPTVAQGDEVGLLIATTTGTDEAIEHRTDALTDWSMCADWN